MTGLPGRAGGVRKGTVEILRKILYGSRKIKGEFHGQ
jgi:hypothetical protein